MEHVFDKDIEDSFKKLYEKGIAEKPTFDEDMQVKIKEELERLAKEAEEILKNRKKEN